MSNKIGNLRAFGKFRLDAERRVLWFDQRPVNVALKEIELLCVLTEHVGEVVTKGELLDRVWADSFVEESNLSRHIYVLRKTLKDLGADGLIETVPRRGYRFAGELDPVQERDVIVERRSQTRTLIEIEENETAETTRPMMSGLLGTRAARTAALGVALAAVLASAFAVFVIRPGAEAGTTHRIRTLAVLPFSVIDVSERDGYAGAGLADVLINRLSAVGGLSVRPASAVMSFDGKDPKRFGEDLGAEGVLEGTIYRNGDRVRVTARLFRTVDDSTIWTGQFERLTQDELVLQSEISRQIANALVVNLTENEKRALNQQHTANLDAYRLYVQGRYEWNKRSAPAMREAERLFRNAIEIDPNFALAYTGLADRMVTSDALEARDLVQRALELDPDLAEAHATMGFIKMFHEWKWREAEDHFQRSIELNPGYATAHHWYAELLAVEGRLDEAVAEMQRAIEINPVSHNFYADLGQIYYFKYDLDRAEAYCRKALEIYPEFSFAYEYLFSIYLKKGDHDKALEASLKADEINTGNTSTEAKARYADYVATLRDAYDRGGMRGYLKLKSSNPQQDGSTMYVKARTLAPLGETERALQALEIAFRDRAFLTPFIKSDPVFDGLRDSPGYREILRKMDLTERTAARLSYTHLAGDVGQ